MSIFCPTWTRYAESTGAESALVITIADPVWTSSAVQGVSPQIFALVGTLGGYLSLMISMFTFVWVRQYPNHEVTNTYEARTLFGYQRTELDEEHGGGLTVNAEHPAAQLPQSSQARETPIGMMQEQRQKMPPLPPIDMTQKQKQQKPAPVAPIGMTQGQRCQKMPVLPPGIYCRTE